MRQWLATALLSCCGLAVQAQSVYDVNHDGKVNVADATRIVDVVMGKIPDTTDPTKGIIDVDASAQNLNAITIWKDGVPTIIYAPDKVYLWNTENEVPEFYDADYEPSEPTATEQKVMQMTNDETTAPVVPFTSEETQKYDAMAQDVIAKFLGKASARSRAALTQEEYEKLDPLAQKTIRDNGENIFSDVLDIGQADWNSGRWGKTRYAADGEFENLYNTYYDDQGRRCLLIVFYHKGGFPNNKLVAVKMGQVNSGVVMDKPRPISAGSEYGYVPVCIDEYLPEYIDKSQGKKGHGRMTLFPLMMTEMPGVAEKAQWPRWYLNPFVVKTKPEISENWKEFVFDEEFGKIDGVSLNCNTSDSVDPITGGFDRNTSTWDNQCTELCVNYAKTIYQLSSSYTKGSAHEWPDKRRPETIDKDGQKVKAWIVIPNDGKRQVREGDFIVWEHPSGTKGHIAVVIETASDRIWVAHQNGGVGDNAWPIGTCLALEGRAVKDHMPKTTKSPIYTNSIPITYIIRKNHSAEDENNEVSDYIPKAMKVSTSKKDFGKVNVGEEVVWPFTVKNTGFTKPLHVSSIRVTGDQVFSVENFSACDIDFDKSRTYNVVFKPTRGQEFSGTIIIESDADDNPVWEISVTGKGVGGGSANIPTNGLVAYYPFNGNANDESGNGNHGKVIGTVELTTDRHGDPKGAYRFFKKELNYISVPDNESLHFSNFTLSAWIYTDADNYGSGYLINKGRDINNGSYRLCVTSVGAQTEYNGKNGVSMPKPTTGVWHMVTGTVEGNKAKIYLDGKFVAENTLSHTFKYNNSEPLTLGMHYYSGVPGYWSYPLLGVMDDVRIYNRVLTPSEIEALYTE